MSNYFLTANHRRSVNYVLLAVLLASLVTVIVVAGLVWTARRLNVSTLDAQDLIAKLAVPHPVSAIDWPELRLRSVIPQPDEAGLVMLEVVWPGHPHSGAILLMALDREDTGAIRLLTSW